MTWTMKDHDHASDRQDAQRIRERFPEIATVSFECMGGWHGILEKMFESIREAIPTGSEDRWSLWQLKEKMAGLRVYHSYANSVDDEQPEDADVRRKIEAAVRLAEARAEHTCDICGQRGRLRARGGWYMTRCDEHADGGVEDPAWLGEKTVYGFGGRHYHFDPDRDQFVEIDNE